MARAYSIVLVLLLFNFHYNAVTYFLVGKKLKFLKDFPVPFSKFQNFSKVTMTTHYLIYILFKESPTELCLKFDEYGGSKVPLANVAWTKVSLTVITRS